MVSIWNLKDPVRTGYLKLATGSRELLGTVVRSGKMDKTVSVLVERWHMNRHYGKYMRSTNLFHCHDGDNYCVTGDKVVIRSCPRMTPIKHFHIRNVVLPMGRNNCYSKNISRDEIAAMKFNEALREKKKARYGFVDI